ncbi:uncharacterized protein LOC133870607 [Alnus glutinosa]|uniref:uncharacterized protein LOC133870607 n=1 Tax=Alnus glutinosa TaxID=3517 RepID=UPI002D78FC64|nr:uncharacterized protein LOC133870607 [Alnus glutinosa]
MNPRDWLCLGDFNEVVDNTEKVDGSLKIASQILPFRSAIEACSLGDLGYKGSKYTWCNDREGVGFIKERLDRALATEGWCVQYPDVEVEVMSARSLDHKPLCVRLLQGHSHTHRGFKFEASWNIDDESSEVIKDKWEKDVAGPYPLAITQRKLERCARALTAWNWAKYEDIGKRISSLTQKLEILQRDQQEGDEEGIRILQEELNNLLEMEEIRWRQRAKRNCFQGGIETRNSYMRE